MAFYTQQDVNKFCDLDKNADGKLDFSEFKGLFQKGKTRLAERDVELLFSSADTSHDGLLDAGEFLNFLRSNKWRNDDEQSSADYGLPNYGPGVQFAPMQAFRTRAARKASGTGHGPTILDGTGFQHSLRSGMHYQGSTFVHTGGHVLDHNVPGHVDSMLDNTRPCSRDASPAAVRPASRGSTAGRSSSLPCGGRPQSQSRRGELRGPERFFYDKSTYTGVHQHGGPSTLDTKGFVSTMRPGQHAGSTFTRTAGRPLDDERPRHIDSRIHG